MPNQSTQRYEFLDGLRGLAAIMVVVFHFNNLLKVYSINAFPKYIDFVLSQGHFGVEIFFVLSGFVIAYSVRNQIISFKFFSQFFLRRSIRLDPPYWVVLCLIIGLSIAGNLLKESPTQMLSYADMTINFFYLADLLQVPLILPVAWTLFLEIQFYLFLILLVKLIQSVNAKFSPDGNAFSMSLPSLGIMLFLMVTSISLNAFKLFPPIHGLFIYHWYSFFIGCLVCWSTLNIIPSVLFWINWGLIGCYACFVCRDAYETCLISALIYFVASKQKMHCYLASSTFQYLGKISYSLYLMHWVVGLRIIELPIRFFRTSLEYPGAVFLLFTVALGLTLLASDLFYRFVELPCLNFSKKIKHMRGYFSRNKSTVSII